MKAESMKKIYKCIEVMVIAIVVFAFALCTYVLLGGKDEPVLFDTEGTFVDYDGWSVNGKELSESDPVYVEGRKGETFTISGIVPLDVDDDWSCMVYAQYSKVDIFVAGECIKSYGGTLPLPFGHMVGNIRVLASLDASMAGQDITIAMTPYYNMNYDTYPPTFGPYYALVLEVLKSNMFRGVVLGFLIIILLICVVLYFFQKSVDLERDSELVAHFACFVICIFLWMLCSSDIPQFYTDASEGVSFISFLSLSIMCIALLGFVKQLLPMGSKVFEAMWAFGWLLPLANLLCFALNICDPMSLLIFTHIYILATIVALVFFSIRCWRTSRDVKLLIVGVGILAVAATIGLIFFYTNPTKGYDAIAFGLGFMLFFAVMVVMIVKRELVFFSEKKFMETYKELAYHDAMTTLENRTAFDNRFSSFTSDTVGNKSITLFIMDLNNLKKTNDEIGHWAGDMSIIGLGECIKNTFENLGNTYRIGGDEFAIILIDKQGQEQGIIKDFEKRLTKFNEHHDIPISVSYGYSTMMWSADNDFYRLIYREADQKMYEMKIKSKKMEQQ